MEHTTLQTTSTQKNIIWGLRILISALFIVSAVGKIYWDPSSYFTLTTFEAKQLVPMGFNADFAQWFSRTLIGCELALGLLILQRHFYSRLILTVSFLMLLIFVIHLSYDMSVHGNKGNCGCFGALIKMTPLEAIIKNLIAMLILGYLYAKRKVVVEGNNYWVLTTGTFFSIMLIFMIGMPKSTIGKPVMLQLSENTGDDTEIVEPKDDTSSVNSSSTVVTQPSSVDSVPVISEPKPKKSGYANLYKDIDKGKKLLCFFAPGCEHCQQAIKDLTAMSKTIKDFPQIKIVFIDEQPEIIPEFFAQAGKQYPYQVKDPGTFFTILGAANTPMVNYLWNGNKIKVYEGTEESGGNYFKPAEFKKIVSKTWDELKKK